MVGKNLRPMLRPTGRRNKAPGEMRSAREGSSPSRIRCDKARR